MTEWQDAKKPQRPGRTAGKVLLDGSFSQESPAWGLQALEGGPVKVSFTHPDSPESTPPRVHTVWQEFAAVAKHTKKNRQGRQTGETGDRLSCSLFYSFFPLFFFFSTPCVSFLVDGRQCRLGSPVFWSLSCQAFFFPLEVVVFASLSCGLFWLASLVSSSFLFFLGLFPLPCLLNVSPRPVLLRFLHAIEWAGVD